MAKTIMHADLDAFFASVEQVENPEYLGKPVLVGGTSRRSVVSAASYEARQFGVHSAMPMWRARQLCPHAVVTPVHGELYKRYSDRVFDILRAYTPLIEPVSIDEAYLDVTGTERLFGPPLELARRIKQQVKDELGITLSVGLSHNRMLAKMASEWDKPDGLFCIREQQLPGLLDPLPVGRLSGIGESTRGRLSQLGVINIGQLRSVPVTLLEREFGKLGLHLHQAAHGRGSDEVCAYYDTPERKQISSETTLEHDSRDLDFLRLRLLSISDTLARRLRQRGCMARTVHLKVRYSNFKLIARSSSLKHPTDTWQDIYRPGVEMLQKVDFGAQRARLIGLGVSNLTEQRGAQLSLFGQSAEDIGKLDQACDRIRDRFGEDAIRQARLWDDE